MPKVTAASPFPSEDEEDKTTIESGWADEASTTVEQGEVAEKVRAVLEPARPAAPRPNGPNSTGITNTNGGALDEPTVDDQHANLGLAIGASHAFARLVVTTGNDVGQELEMRPGKTYTVGRGVDNDIVLTDIAVSRKHFDLRNEAGAWVLIDRGSGNGTLINNSLEDHPFMLANGDVIEIGNTTFRFELPNGLPRLQPTYDVSMDEEEPSTVAGKPVRTEELSASQFPTPLAVRPKTLPPPAPSRARSLSSAPPFSPPSPLPPAPASTLPVPQMAPMAQMASRAPVLAPHLPTMLGADGPPPLLPGVMPSTIPGQGMPVQPAPIYSPRYPHGSEQQPYAQHPGQGPLVINSPGLPTRDATSTALVPPVPYGSHPMQVAQPLYAQPVISRRTKLILGGVGLSLFAAIATVAIIKGSSSPAAKPEAKPEAPKVAPPPKTGPTVEEITPTPPKADPPKVVAPKVDAPKVVTPTITPKADPPKVEPPKVVKAEPPKVEPPKVVKAEPPPKKEPPKKEPPKVEPPKVVKADPPPKKEPAPKRTATADLSGYKSKADDQYKAKNFAGAAATLKSASANVGDEDGKDLRSMAAVYAQLGKAYALGMAPGTPPKDALEQLNKARNLDNSAGRAYTSEINARIGQVAPKAAVSFMAAKSYEDAAQAIRLAESVGSSSSNIASVKSALESAARNLYNEAMAQKGSDPDAAKQKLRQVQKIVPSSSSWYQKAGKALSAG